MSEDKFSNDELKKLMTPPLRLRQGGSWNSGDIAWNILDSNNKIVNSEFLNMWDKDYHWKM